MQPIKFTPYAINTSYYDQVGPVPFEHTFVVSEAGDDWNCWGRGRDTINAGAREISPTGSGLVDWARLLYGTDPQHPTDLSQEFEGVCHHASNRILVIAGSDVSSAHGNLYATLLYGKYGFHLQDYVEKLKRTADQLNSQSPGVVTESCLQTVLERIGKDPEDELGLLENHLQDALSDSITAEENAQLLIPFKEFQAKRQTAFDEEWDKRDSTGFQRRFAQKIQPLFMECLNYFGEILGPDKFKAIFKCLPEQVIGNLLRI